MAYAFNDDKTKARIVVESGSVSINGVSDKDIEIDLTQKYGITRSDMSKVHVLGVMQSVSPNSTWNSSVYTTQYQADPHAAIVFGGDAPDAAEHVVLKIVVRNVSPSRVTVYGKAVLMFLD